VAQTAARKPIFAKRLAQARDRAGMSQKQLGLLAGMDPSVASPRINQYEKGKHEPQLETAKRLAEALGIPPAFLYTEDDQLAKLLLLWSDMSPAERKKLLSHAQAGHKTR
jgi:transcriptional regulator with XRE-family HTH domain